MNKINITKSAKYEIIKILNNSLNNLLKFRIYICGGGCNGLLYKFILDIYDEYNDIILINNPFIISDYISFTYIKNGTIDYKNEIMSTYFYISNPNIKSLCNCGKSFKI